MTCDCMRIWLKEGPSSLRIEAEKMENIRIDQFYRAVLSIYGTFTLDLRRAFEQPMQHSQQSMKQEVKTRPYYSCGKRKQPYNRSKQADANAGFKKGNRRSEVSLIKKARSQVPSQQSSASNAPYREDSASNPSPSEDERRKQIFRLESRTAKLREDIASIQRKAFLAEEKLKDAEKRLEQDKKKYIDALDQEKQFYKSEKLNKTEGSKSSAKQTDSLQKEKQIQKSDKSNKAESLTKWATKLEEIYKDAKSRRDQIVEQLKKQSELRLQLRRKLETHEDKLSSLEGLDMTDKQGSRPAQRKQ